MIKQRSKKLKKISLEDQIDQQKPLNDFECLDGENFENS